MSLKRIYNTIWYKYEAMKYDNIHISDASDQSDQENNSEKSFSSLEKTSSSFLSNSLNRSFVRNISASKKRRRSQFKPLDNVKIFRKTMPSESGLSISLKESNDANKDSSRQKVNSVFDTCNMKRNNVSDTDLLDPKERIIQKYDDDTDIECSTDEEDLNETRILNIHSEEIECDSNDGKDYSESISKTNESIIASRDDNGEEENTELDEFLALIEKETQLLNKSSPIRAAEQSPRTRPMRCKKGGYLDQLQNFLDSAKADRKYLAHDKRYNLSNGNLYEILEINSQFGINLVTLRPSPKQTSSDNTSIHTIIPNDLIYNMKIGQNVELFFDESIEPYCLNNIPGSLMYKLHIQPNKILNE